MSTTTSPSTNAMDSYIELSLCAEINGHLCNHRRRAADKYLEAIQAAPSKWAAGRWKYFHFYCAIVSSSDDECDVKATQTDKQAIKCIAKDETEPNLFRARALDTLGRLKITAGNKEKGAHLYRMAMDVIYAATSTERKQQVIESDRQERLVGEILDTMLAHLKKVLYVLENPQTRFPNDGVTGIPIDNGILDPIIMQRLAVGGSKCDCCGKNRTDVDGGLFRCSCCRKAYYCSPECQHRNWRAGHRHACRAPGQIEVGDYMILKGLVKRPELNSLVGHIVRPVRGGRFEVSIEGRSGTLSIASEKLEHLRPAA